MATAAGSFGVLRARSPGPVWLNWSDALGVGHIFACTVSDVGVLRSMRAFIAMCASGDF